MRCLVVLIFILPCVFSTNNTFKDFCEFSLEQLINLTKNLDIKGNTYIPRLTTLKVEIDELSLYVYTRSNTSGSQVSFRDASQLTNLSSFNLNLKTVIYTYGWLDNYNGTGSVLIREALLNASDINVIILNWDKCANSINYLTSWGCVEGIGKYLGEVLTSLHNTCNYSLSDITLVGHSLGAHISGYAGKHTNGTLGIIVGLDPAAPLFFNAQPNHRLNATDAQFVQAIHTCAQFLGVSYSVGRSDFWPNGGYNQAGCELSFGQCSHIRAYLYYAESVSSNNFIGRQCDNYKHYEAGTCDDNPTSFMAGINVDISAEGDYFLDTNEESPFGKGNL